MKNCPSCNTEHNKNGLYCSYSCANKRRGNTFSNEEVFIEQSTYPRHAVKGRVIKQKLLEYKCQCCGIGPEWLGKPMPLILDHINGVNNDNRLTNLRFVCSNCDSQLPTYKSKNRK